MTSHPSSYIANHLYISSAVALLLSSAIMPLFRRNYMPVENRTILVTGGSQGMGKALAILLSSKGAHVCVVARNQEKLDLALSEIKASAKTSTQKFHCISADMSDPASVDRAFTEFAAWSGNPCPDIVWTCAGGTSPGYFKDHTSESVEKELSTNYRTTLHTAHAAVRRMASAPPDNNRRRGEKRHLIFTSSVLAFYPIAGYSTYAPCKAAIRALADGLRQECLLWDIRVACCFPATILSPGYAQELECRPELTDILEGSDEGQTPEVVAEKCLAGLQKGQTLVTTNFLGMLMRGGSWGGSPRGNVVIDTVVGWVLIVVWAVARLVMDREVTNYRKKLEKEGRKV